MVVNRKEVKMIEQDVLIMLKNNPHQAHKDIIASGGYPALKAWVQQMAIDHKMVLMVLPNTEYETRKWKMVATILTSEIVFSEHNHPYDPKDVQGLFEMPTHMRQACTVMRNGVEHLRNGSLVRRDKLKPSDREAFISMLNKYNKDQKKRAKEMGLGFQSIMDWFNEHPEARDIWYEQLRKRKEKENEKAN